MLDNDLLLHWFSVNADREHPKLSPVPIGLMNMGYRRKLTISSRNFFNFFFFGFFVGSLRRA